MPQAKRDIDRNADWSAEHYSVELAVKWSDAVYDQLETLAKFPERNGLSAENGEFPFEIRGKLVGVGPRPSYRVVFTIKNETVYVLAFRRGPKTHSGHVISSPRRPADPAGS